MRKYINNQGLTLIEVLATLTLLAIVGGLVFGILINSLNIFNLEDNDNDIMQKANIIESQITTFYKVNGNFEASTMDGILTITSEKKDGTIESREFSVPDYSIEVESNDGDASDGYVSKDITISIVNMDDAEDNFILESNISRLKDGE